MERPLTDWERSVLTTLASVSGEGAEVIREALPHLVVTGGCECGCASFNLHDARCPEQPHELSHFSNGWTEGWSFVLWLGPDGKPKAVDAEPKNGDAPEPDPLTITVAPAGP